MIGRVVDTDGVPGDPMELGHGLMLLGVGGDAEGNGVALFGREDGVLTASGYDAAPPRIASLSVPSDGIAGDPLDFAATGLDVWSGRVTDVTWDFGDGERASGAALRHAYADAGARVIEATLRDAVGNASSGFAVTTIDAPIAVPTIIPTPAGSPPSPPRRRHRHRCATPARRR